MIFYFLVEYLDDTDDDQTYELENELESESSEDVPGADEEDEPEDDNLKKAEAAREAKKKSAEAAKTDPSRLAFAFDLQKTLPTPMLTCSKVYYSRQL